MPCQTWLRQSRGRRGHRLPLHWVCLCHPDMFINGIKVFHGSLLNMERKRITAKTKQALKTNEQEHFLEHLLLSLNIYFR